MSLVTYKTKLIGKDRQKIDYALWPFHYTWNLPFYMFYTENKWKSHELKIGFLFHVFRQKEKYIHTLYFDGLQMLACSCPCMSCSCSFYYHIIYVILNKWKNNRQCCDSNYNHNCLNRQFFDCLENVVTDERSVGCLSGVWSRKQHILFKWLKRISFVHVKVAKYH